MQTYVPMSHIETGREGCIVDVMQSWPVFASFNDCLYL